MSATLQGAQGLLQRADIWHRMTASIETERGTERGPITRAEADKAYRAIRAAILASAACFAVMSLVLMLFDIAGWQFYLGAAALVEGVGMPLFLRSYRRELDQRVRDSALSHIIDDDRR